MWKEITLDPNSILFNRIEKYFRDKVKEIKRPNHLTFILDFGESEAVMLFEELNADYLLIDDRKARDIAENLGIECIGTIGLLSIAKEKGMIGELKPIFESFLKTKRYYSLNLLNYILDKHGEDEILISS